VAATHDSRETGPKRPVVVIATANEAAGVRHQDGTLFASVDETRLVFVDVERGEDIGAIELGGAPVKSVAFMHDGRTVIVAHLDGTIDGVDADPESWADRACAIARSEAALERWTRSAPAGTSAPSRCNAPARR